LEIIKPVKLQYDQYYWRFLSVLLQVLADNKPVRYKVKIKVKVATLHGNQAKRSGVCVALPILISDTRSGWVIVPLPPLYLLEVTQYQFYREPGGTRGGC
jgi:hypothetical protein